MYLQSFNHLGSIGVGGLTEDIAFNILRSTGPMMGTVVMSTEFRNYKGGIISRKGRPGDFKHSIAIVGMDKTTGCFKIQNSDFNWGVNKEGWGWILYSRVTDILSFGVTTAHPEKVHKFPPIPIRCCWGPVKGPRSVRTRRGYTPPYRMH